MPVASTLPSPYNVIGSGLASPLSLLCHHPCTLEYDRTRETRCRTRDTRPSPDHPAKASIPKITTSLRCHQRSAPPIRSPSTGTSRRVNLTCALTCRATLHHRTQYHPQRSPPSRRAHRAPPPRPACTRSIYSETAIYPATNRSGTPQRGCTLPSPTLTAHCSSNMRHACAPRPIVPGPAAVRVAMCQGHASLRGASRSPELLCSAAGGWRPAKCSG